MSVDPGVELNNSLNCKVNSLTSATCCRVRFLPTLSPSVSSSSKVTTSSSFVTLSGITATARADAEGVIHDFKKLVCTMELLACM